MLPNSSNHKYYENRVEAWVRMHRQKSSYIPTYTPVYSPERYLNDEFYHCLKQRQKFCFPHYNLPLAHHRQSARTEMFGLMDPANKRVELKRIFNRC